MIWDFNLKSLQKWINFKKEKCPHCGKCQMMYDTDGSYINWECKTS